MMSILETERLILREFTTDDTKFIVELLNSDGWLKYIGDRNVKSEEQAVNYLMNGPIKSYKLHGFGLSLVELKNNKTPIGMCGLIKRENLEYPDIGFAFLPEFMGKGYAFEIANATIIFAKEELKFDKIVAITVSYNKNSIKLLEKIGLKYIKPYFLPYEDEELMLFSN